MPPLPDESPSAPPSESGTLSWVHRLVGSRPGETRAVCLGFACFFCLLASYSVLRPVRDQIGVAGGSPLMFRLGWWTLGAMLLAQPLLGWLVSKVPVRWSITLVFHFFAIHLIGFYALQLWLDPNVPTWVRWVFYVWLSVFNLFV